MTQLYEQATIHFNKKPKDGIAFMREAGYSSVEEIAKFLHNAQGINMVKLGDILGDQYVGGGGTVVRARWHGH